MRACADAIDVCDRLRQLPVMHVWCVGDKVSHCSRNFQTMPALLCLPAVGPFHGPADSTVSPSIICPRCGAATPLLAGSESMVGGPMSGSRGWRINWARRSAPEWLHECQRCICKRAGCEFAYSLKHAAADDTRKPGGGGGNRKLIFAAFASPCAPHSCAMGSTSGRRAKGFDNGALMV